MGLLLAFGESSSALILHKLLFVKLGKDANFTKCKFGKRRHKELHWETPTLIISICSSILVA